MNRIFASFFFCMAVIYAGGCAARSSALECAAAAKSPGLGWMLGYTITLELVENPTTGYLWSRPEFDAAVFELQSDSYTAPSGDLAGAPGKRTFVFRSIGAGESRIRTVYARPWEKDVPPARIFDEPFQIVDAAEETSADSPPLLRISGDVRISMQE